MGNLDWGPFRPSSNCPNLKVGITFIIAPSSKELCQSGESNQQRHCMNPGRMGVDFGVIENFFLSTGVGLNFGHQPRQLTPRSQQQMDDLGLIMVMCCAVRDCGLKQILEGEKWEFEGCSLHDAIAGLDKRIDWNWSGVWANHVCGHKWGERKWWVQCDLKDWQFDLTDSAGFGHFFGHFAFFVEKNWLVY